MGNLTYFQEKLAKSHLWPFLYITILLVGFQNFFIKWDCQSQATREGKSEILKTSNFLLRSCYMVWTCHRTQKFGQTLLHLFKIKDLRSLCYTLDLVLKILFSPIFDTRRTHWLMLLGHVGQNVSKIGLLIQFC